MIQKKQTVKQAPKKSIKKPDKTIFKYVWMVGGGSLVLILFVFTFIKVYSIYQGNNQRVNKLDREIIDLRSSMNIDSVRQYKLQKIISIIKEYNDDLSSSEVYDIASEIYEMSIKYSNLDIDLLCAVVTHESGLTWDPTVVSKAGALGLMQIMPVTGLFLAEYEGITWTTPEDVCFNPIYNIRMGSRFLSTFAFISEHCLNQAGCLVNIQNIRMEVKACLNFSTECSKSPKAFSLSASSASFSASSRTLGLIITIRIII